MMKMVDFELEKLLKDKSKVLKESKNESAKKKSALKK
jgi:hypothetical protein